MFSKPFTTKDAKNEYVEIGIEALGSFIVSAIDNRIKWEGRWLEGSPGSTTISVPIKDKNEIIEKLKKQATLYHIVSINGENTAEGEEVFRNNNPFLRNGSLA